MLELPLRLGEYEGKGEWGEERSWSMAVAVRVVVMGSGWVQ